MKKINILLLALIFTLSVIAQENNSKKAKEILDKLSEKTKSYTNIQVNFKFVMENLAEEIEETYYGELWVKGNMYRLDLMGTTTWFDGTTIWTYLKDANEVNITEPDEDEDSALNPAKILTLYEKGFKYYYKAEKFEANRALQIIDLIPEDLEMGLTGDKREKDYTRITLKIDKTKNELYSIIRYGKDGNIYTITVGKFNTAKIFTTSMFKFNKAKYPDVEIIDMR